MKLVMTIPFRNHINLIKDNIYYHAMHGIDAFVFIDHNSTDGSRDIVEEFSKIYPTCIIEKKNSAFKDGEFRTEMAFKARDYFGADWVISNDVDEFWLPKNGTFKEALLKSGKNVVYFYRQNMVPFTHIPKSEKISPPRKYYYLISHPIETDLQLVEKYNHVLENIPADEMLLKEETGKAACALKGLNRIDAGSHEIFIENRESIISNDILIVHYPYDTPEIFLADVKGKVERVLSDKSLQDFQDYHVRRWNILLQKGQFDKEIAGTFPNEETLIKWLQKGVVTENMYIYDFLTKHTL